MSRRFTHVFVLGLSIVISFMTLSLYRYAQEFRSPPNRTFTDSTKACPTEQITSGIVNYLQDTRIRRYVAHKYILLNRKSAVTNIPPSLAEKVFDWERAKYWSQAEHVSVLVSLICQSPALTVGDMKLAGLPALAAYKLKKPLDKISEYEAEIVACGFSGEDPEAYQFFFKDGVSISV